MICCVEVEGKNLKEVASFVSNKLSPIESCHFDKNNFILKKYKQDGIIFEELRRRPTLALSP